MSIADRVFDAPFHFITRHALALGLALAMGILVFTVPLTWWEKSGTALFFVGVLLLVLVLVPGIGRTVNGATRWIPLGPLNIQSSEFMKFFAVIYVSRLPGTPARGGGDPPVRFPQANVPDGDRQRSDHASAGLRHHRRLVGHRAGSALSRRCAGDPFRDSVRDAGDRRGDAWWRSSPIGCSGSPPFMDPFADPFNTRVSALPGAHCVRARASGSGWVSATVSRKQFFLPEAHTDFLMAVVGEELGLVGTLAVIAAFRSSCGGRFPSVPEQSVRAGCSPLTRLTDSALESVFKP